MPGSGEDSIIAKSIKHNRTGTVKYLPEHWHLPMALVENNIVCVEKNWYELNAVLPNHDSGDAMTLSTKMFKEECDGAMALASVLLCVCMLLGVLGV
eukprot:5516966-Lingulodinium_polyedra.AAC.1